MYTHVTACQILQFSVHKSCWFFFVCFVLLMKLIHQHHVCTLCLMAFWYKPTLCFCFFCMTSAGPVMERVSGNIVEFQMSSLTPATHYTVKVYAVRDLAKSAATTTEFTTGECFWKFSILLQELFIQTTYKSILRQQYLHTFLHMCIHMCLYETHLKPKTGGDK